MNDRDQVEAGSHIPGFREAIAGVSGDDDAFFGWFNNQKSFDEAYFSGAWDFSWHIAQPLARHLRRSVTAGPGLSALEIGCGGGRLLAHAARFFPRVIGVDIHDQLGVVSDRLRAIGVHNADVRQGDGRTLPCADAEVDVVYSFIVFQHLEKIEILKAYLREAFRVLRPGGLAMIYAGRLRTNSAQRDSRLRLQWDLWLERFRLPNGYLETPAPVNSTNLRVSRSFMLAETRRIGFAPLMTCVSRRQVPEETVRYGGQHGFLLQKPA
jgi:cyclopropane fatty-acyl-phospholipid synthase-like methyltransferase